MSTPRSLQPPPCAQPPASANGQDAPIDVRSSIAALIEGRDVALDALSREERSELQALYASADAPLWVDAGGRPTRNFRDAAALLSAAADEGLDPADYYHDVIARLTSGSDVVLSTPQDLARFDVAASAGVLRYLRDLHMGRIDPRSIGFRLDAPLDRHDFAADLRSAITGQRLTRLASDLRPPLVQYRLLRAMLPRYRALAADARLATFPQIGRSIHPGEPFADIAALQRTLIAVGDLPASTPEPETPARYDKALIEGVKRFQVRHGLEADGVLGKRTVDALHVPLTWRARQIELALERLRWLPHPGDERLIVLNIPMFRLWAWDSIPPSGMPLFGMDVIVGRALSTETPVFAEQMREVIFRPYWNVPPSILRHEVLPQIERDPDYLRRENMEIVRGQGDNASHVDLSAEALESLRRGALRVRQRPGPKNALGLIKFVFPNREDVYMHGTPAQALFARSRRDFSHGCVRVADPVALAEWVLQDRPEWTRERILAATTATRTDRVALPHPVQVLLFYTTAAVMPETGAVHFAEDIYRQDDRLDRALDGLHRVRTRGDSAWTGSR